MSDAERSRKNATELVALTPDVLFATTFPTVAALQQATRAVPIVFAGVIDPVGAGLVASLARPGGNTTGFAGFEYGLSAKWLELLKQVAPRLTRVAVLRDSLTPVGIGQLAAIQGVASSFGVELSPLVVRDVGEIEPAVAAFARSSNDGLIVTIGTLTDAHREVISALAARHRLPAVYPFPFFVRSGGLISYGPNIVDSFRGAAGYVDRILKGEKPADLPVHQPTKYRLGHQSQNRQGARPRNPAHAARSRRRGDRVSSRREFITLLGGAARVAARGAGAAARADAARRCAPVHRRGRSARPNAPSGIRTRLARIGLDGRSQPTDRSPLGCRRCR